MASPDKAPGLTKPELLKILTEELKKHGVEHLSPSLTDVIVKKSKGAKEVVKKSRSGPSGWARWAEKKKKDNQDDQPMKPAPDPLGLNPIPFLT